MLKMKVHEFAKDINMASKDVIAILKTYDIPAKTYMSNIEEKQMDVVLDYLTHKFEEEGNFDFSVFDKKPEPAPEVKKAEAKQEKPRAAKPSKTHNVRYVDTRQSSVDLEKIDTSNKIEEEMVPTHIKGQKHEASKPAKQKPRKNNFPGNHNAHPAQGKGNKQTPAPKPPVKKREEHPEITIPDEIMVGDLAAKMKISPAEIIKKLMALGVMSTVNQVIDFETAELVATDLGAIVTREIVVTIEERLFHDEEDKAEDLVPRSPVVVVMGHVDHGKTSLLDAIRKTHVTASEAGGITQHIGAYRVKIHDRDITFLDTPGHEAFTAMRARGAQVTDIAILVVAADDGIMPQTIEAINHAKAAEVDIIVAINKIDKEGANPDRVKQELMEHGMVCEDWGGDTICVPVSAKMGEGIDQLLEMVMLTADMRELKANPNRSAKGTVIESKLDKGRGPVATVLVQNGTLQVGDILVAGSAVGRVRAMIDDKGRRIKKAGPSIPVEITGLNETPDGGDLFHVVEDEKLARTFVERKKEKEKQERISQRSMVSLDDLFDRIKEGEVKDLNLIIKADVQGSVEAVKQSLEKLSNEEVRVRAIHGGVGGVTESDVMLAAASNAIIVGFNVRPAPSASVMAQEQEVDMRLYRVIYEAIEEIEAAMKGMLAPTYKEVVLGHAEVRQTFKASGVGTIGGCYVLDGKIARNSSVRVVRDGIVIHDGSLQSLKRFKDDVKEVATGYECGMNLDRFNDIKEGDVIECYVMEEIKR